MKTITKKQIRLLKNQYGNHTQVAKSLGITPRYYRNLRNGKLLPGKFLRLELLRLASEVKT